MLEFCKQALFGAFVFHVLVLIAISGLVLGVFLMEQLTEYGLL